MGTGEPARNGTVVNGDRPPPRYADIETASEDYAMRFTGSVGRWLLSVQEAAVRRALEGVPAGARILDVGGGHAQLVPLYAQLGLESVVAGSGASPGRFLEPFVADGQVSWKRADLLALPFADRSFDVVVSVRLLSHVENWEHLLSELCRVSAGQVVVDYPSRHSVNVLAGPAFGWKKRVERNTRPFALFGSEEIAGTLAMAGFEVESEWRQFLFPMALHRLLGNPRLSRRLEATVRRAGLTGRLGSPVVVRADRRPDVSHGR
jgi:SAM-dependent methyltransferase